MKWNGQLMPDIADMENLRLAFLKASRGKNGKVEVVRFRDRLDDFVIWSDERDSLKAGLPELEAFLDRHLHLQFKPSHFINRTECGMDFLGIRLFPYRTRLNRRSRCRFVRKWRAYEQAHAEGAMPELDLQTRVTALVPEGQPVRVTVEALPPSFRPGSAEAILKSMREPPHLSDREVAELEAAIEAGRLPVLDCIVLNEGK